MYKHTKCKHQTLLNVNFSTAVTENLCIPNFLTILTFISMPVHPFVWSADNKVLLLI